MGSEYSVFAAITPVSLLRGISDSISKFAKNAVRMILGVVKYLSRIGDMLMGALAGIIRASVGSVGVWSVVPEMYTSNQPVGQGDTTGIYAIVSGFIAYLIVRELLRQNRRDGEAKNNVKLYSGTSKSADQTRTSYDGKGEIGESEDVQEIVRSVKSSEGISKRTKPTKASVKEGEGIEGVSDEIPVIYEASGDRVIVDLRGVSLTVEQAERLTQGLGIAAKLSEVVRQSESAE